MSLTVNDVDAFDDYDEPIKWLEERDIKYDDLESLEELKDLIKEHLKVDGSSKQQAGRESAAYHGGSGLRANDSQQMMKDILSRDQVMKVELAEVYTYLETFVKTDIGDELKEVMANMYANYEETLHCYKSELTNDECPIVVAGETSAGKSSLLNLLLGTDVLPHSLLCATSTICRLHNSDKKRIVIKTAEESDDPIHISINEDEGDTSAALKEKLKPYVSSAGTRKQQEYKQVDIYWPIPMLQDRVTIVDTPGVGESKDMTQRLMDYLPNAVAFIYVINSAIAGGIQEDKLLHIIAEQQRWEREGKLSSFDYKCTLFVCNKWDRVEETSEEEKVWKDTRDKLKCALKDLPDEQIFKMSTTEAARYLKNGMGHTEKFQKLLEGIEQMVPASLKAKIKRHYKWIEKFLYKLQNSITSRINHARSTEEEKRRLYNKVLERLTKLQSSSDMVKTKLTEKAERECEDIVDKLHLHLQDESVKERLCSWRDEEAPNIEAGDLEVTKFSAEKRIMTKLQEEFKTWENEQQLIKMLSDNLTRMFKQECQVLGQECRDVDLIILGTSSEFDFQAENGQNDSEKQDGDSSLFTGSEKLILTIAAPLWIPLVTAAAILFLPVGIGMFIRQGVRDSSQRKMYQSNKAVFMSEWTKKLIETSFTKENLRRFIRTTYFENFKCKITEVCEIFIPRLIAADQRQVNDILNDRRSSKEILGQFLPIQRKVKAVLGRFHLYGLKYMTDDRIDLKAIRREKLLGKGNFSDVFQANWTRPDGEVLQVALKVLRRSLEGEDIYSQLTEVDCLRKLKHPNIVEFYGVSYSALGNATADGDDALNRGLTTSWEQVTGNTLMLLLEHCEGSLEHKVFNDETLQCRRYDSVLRRKDAFKFYVTMAKGICDGLAYIHGKGFLHRDLKLSNVLVKHNSAKICDLGFARHEVATTGTFVGTLTHMSPELLENNRYTFTTDIYSLAILLWELWYGRPSYSEPEYESQTMLQLNDFIKSGMRPKFYAGTNYKYRVTNELEKLIEKCWDQTPTNRPSAEDVGTELSEMYVHYYKEDINV